MTMNNCVNAVVIIINFYYIGRLEDALLQTSFGLGVTYWGNFSLTMNICSFETTGIHCSKSFGRKDFESLSANLCQGFIFQGLLSFFSVTMFFFSEEALWAFGFSPENAVLTSIMVKWLIPTIILHGFNLQFVAFCVSQGISTPFGISNFLSIAVCAFMCPYLANNLHVGI
jgi:Na+-driven multidrug efflux pump